MAGVNEKVLRILDKRISSLENMRYRYALNPPPNDTQRKIQDLITRATPPTDAEVRDLGLYFNEFVDYGGDVALDYRDGGYTDFYRWFSDLDSPTQVALIFLAMQGVYDRQKLIVLANTQAPLMMESFYQAACLILPKYYVSQNLLPEGIDPNLAGAAIVAYIQRGFSINLGLIALMNPDSTAALGADVTAKMAVLSARFKVFLRYAPDLWQVATHFTVYFLSKDLTRAVGNCTFRQAVYIRAKMLSGSVIHKLNTAFKQKQAAADNTQADDTQEAIYGHDRVYFLAGLLFIADQLLKICPEVTEDYNPNSGFWQAINGGGGLMGGLQGLARTPLDNATARHVLQAFRAWLEEVDLSQAYLGGHEYEIM
ncbi:hypothetical protein HHE02_12260 [Helicobacter heilmannii]|uniref:hypothetical protein n=1 Tax=Helicobacter heilmannii TaxID=35817 RepID=UPI0006A22CEB|nr:hypothetical protein [Helicobacter heilmannii]CRF47925.1 hypothetical protein HHE02_12260 [Helicobacter heilmannii]